MGRRWKWILAGLILTAAIVSFYYLSYLNFKKTIVSSFNAQQSVIARSMQNFLKFYLEEARQNLAHTVDMMRSNHGSTIAIRASIDRARRAQKDDFIAITLISDSEILYTSPPELRGSIGPSTLASLKDTHSFSEPFLSGRATYRDQSTTHLFLPFTVPGSDSVNYIVGSLDIKAFVNRHQPGWNQEVISLVLADFEGDVYVITNLDHDKQVLMEEGNIFRIEGTECGGCHSAVQFDDIREAMRTGSMVQAIEATPERKLYNRTTIPFDLYQETWTISVLSPYSTVQGTLERSFRRNALYTILSLLLAGAFSLILHKTQKSRAILEERSVAEKGLREGERQYRALFDGSNDAIYILQPSESTPVITSANRRAVEMLGCDSLEEFLNTSPMDLLPLYQQDGKLSSAKLSRLWTRALEGEVQTAELVHRKSDGSEFPCEVTVSCVEIGSRKYLQAVLRDITERKKADADRLRIDKLKSISTLAGGIAHDFNNLLAGIMGNIGLARLLMKSDPSNTIELQATLDTAEKACDKAAALTKRMLNFAGKSNEPYRRRINDLEEVVREDASMALHGSNVAAEYHFSGDLLPAHADPDQVGQVIHNLVKNAREAMPRGGVVRISAENEFVSSHASLEPGTYVKITIHDEGEGIPENRLRKIFEAYYSTKEDGQGLGLSSVQNIIQQHGGVIEVSSLVGEGTTFTFRLPSGVDVVREPEDLPDSLPVRGKGEKVLIIDDDRDVGESIRKTLDELGYSGAFFSRSSEAIAAYRQASEAGDPFDLVITDLTLPNDLSGIQIRDEIRKIDPCGRIILTSGYLEHPAMSRASSHEFNATIPKPVNVHALGATVARVLSSDRRRSAEDFSIPSGEKED
jgi:PAS domain S-box-containing protein